MFLYLKETIKEIILIIVHDDYDDDQDNEEHTLFISFSLLLLW